MITEADQTPSQLLKDAFGGDSTTDPTEPSLTGPAVPASAPLTVVADHANTTVSLSGNHLVVRLDIVILVALAVLGMWFIGVVRSLLRRVHDLETSVHHRLLTT